jgi:regulator of sirC expression with transglutaminase-like and TPR domain
MLRRRSGVIGGRVYPAEAALPVAAAGRRGYPQRVEPSRPSERFREIALRLRRGDAGLGLGEVALAIAGEFQPELDAAEARAELDRRGAEAADALSSGGGAGERAAGLVRFLRHACGFRGNEEHYDDLRNHFLNEVLARRTGIPITLAVVYVEVAACIGLPLAGVSFPAHFLARTTGEPPVVIDPFHGVLLDEAGCRALLARALGAQARFGPERLAPASPAEVALRMLGNLKHRYAARRDFLRALDCCERMLLIAPASPGEIRDRGLLYEQLECFGPALDDLERFLALAPDAPEASALRARVEALRPRVAHIH